MMTLDELELYFNSHSVAEGTFLNKATKIVDPAQFLRVNFDNARHWKGDISKCPNYWHLCELQQQLSQQI